MTAVVLAAGKSTRMGAATPKVLLPLLGRPLIGYVLDSVRRAGLERIVLVVGGGRDEFERLFASAGLEFATQDEQRGTADAVLACRGMMDADEDCVVLCGDTPLLTGGTISGLVDLYRGTPQADMAVLTALLDNPSGYGRVVRGEGDFVCAIVEDRDATEEQRDIREVNSGVYVFRWGRLLPFLERVACSPVTGEYYLTDAVRALAASGGVVVPVPAKDPDEILGVNTAEQFDAVADLLAFRQRAGER